MSTTQDGIAARLPREMGLGHDRFRLSRWYPDQRAVQIGLTPQVRPPSHSSVRWMLHHLGRRGVETAVTVALRDHELPPFLDNGFEVRETLVVLSTDLDPHRAARPSGTNPRLRRARRTDRRTVLEVDHAAFDPSWWIGAEGLADALAATPSSRFRVAGDTPVGYVIGGRSASMGYVQRLAVRPEYEGCGIGAALLDDVLGWMARRGVRRSMVNTQQGNERALALYLSRGFRPEYEGLTVLHRSLHHT